MQLNPRQLEAVRHFETPLLVLAGAGSGKTGVITEKIAWLIESRSYDPASIIAVTFTNKAANEMRSRLQKRLQTPARVRAQKGAAGRLPMICTFHRLGMHILHRDGEAIGLRRGFTIIDQGDSIASCRELIRESNSAIEERDLQRLISTWKNDFIDSTAAETLAADDRERVAARLYARYDELLRQCNSVDFDDLIGLSVRLFREHPTIEARWRGRVRHLLVDEYQDTNAAQYELVKHLVDRFGALTAVGDDDQSIYAWRGARPENLSHLQVDYPNLAVIKLEQNYRSSQRILRSANALIQNNPHVFEKRLWSELGLGDPLRLSVCRHTQDEAEWVAAEILTRHFRSGTPWRDFAVLYRGNFQSRPFEQALREKQIPYAISGGSSFFDRREIRDMLAYLRLMVNADDDTAFLRCINTPRREIGPTTLGKLGDQARRRGISLFAACHDVGLASVLDGRATERLARFANWLTLKSDNAERGDVVGVVRELFEDIDYRDWLEEQHDSTAKARHAIENSESLLATIERLATDHEARDRSLTDIVRQLCLNDMLSRQDEEAADDRVQMSTLHAAKGLEFPHVFMVGMEEDLMPHRNSIEADTLEEERRLAYVGMTRARHTLTFTRARSRQRHGETSAAEASRFLDELPSEDLVVLGELGNRDPAAARSEGQSALRDLRALLAND